MPINTYVHVYVKAPVVVRITSTPTPLTADNLVLNGDGNPDVVYSFDNVEDATSLQEEVVDLSADPNPDPAPSVVNFGCKAEFYAGFRLSTLLYGDKAFRNKLGLYYFEDLGSGDRKLSYKFVRNSNTMVALDFVTRVSLTLKAVDPNAKYEAWGQTHRTYVVYANTITLADAKEILYRATFEIGELKKKYKVMPNSIVRHHSRKSSIIGN